MLTERWIERVRNACSFFLALSWALCPRHVAAQVATGRKPSLQWTRSAGAESCIDPQSLAQRVEALTGPRLTAPRDADYSIEGHAEARAGHGFVAELRIARTGKAPRGLRKLEHASPDCRGFDQQLAFVIALMIDPELDLDDVVDAPSAEPGQTLLAELPDPVVHDTQLLSPPAPLPALPAPELRPPPTLHYELALGSTLLAADMPGAALGAQLALALHTGRSWALAASVRGDTSAAPVPLDAGLRMRSSRVAFALLGCLRQPLGAGFRVLFCLGLEPELWLAQGVGFIAEDHARKWAWGGVLHAELAYALTPRSALTLGGLGRLNMTAPRFRYDLDAATIDTPKAGFVRAGVILGVRIHLSSV